MSRRDAAIFAGLAAAYFVSAKLGLRLAIVHRSATAVWPPTGIAFASFLILGRRFWPAILTGAFLANVTTAGSIPACLGIAAGNTLEGLAGSYLVTRFAGGRSLFDRAEDFFRFTLLIAPVSTAVSATIGVTSLCLDGSASWSSFGAIWMTWWLGDLIGAVVVTPLILVWAAQLRAPLEHAAEAALLALCLTVLALMVFGGYFPSTAQNFPLEFLCVPPLIWAAFRFGQREAVTAVVVLAGVAIRGTLRGYGPFARIDPNESLLLLQAFLGVTATMTVAVAAVVMQRRRAEQETLQLNQELERRVADRTSALAQSNAELEAFTHSVSHDLRAPLRHIHTFAEFLHEDYQQQLDEQGRRYLTRIQEGAVRMAGLIEDLMRLSYLGRQPLDRKKTDLGKIFDEALRDMSEDIKDRRIEWRIGSLPVCECDPGLVKVVFSNLLANAVKFTRPREKAVIEVGQVAADDCVAIYVRDNGIGFDMKYAGRLFGVFQRLEQPEEFEGSGVGLATAERIVRKHGGMIWAEAQPDKGASFYFTLGAGKAVK